jgi:hypothetical protein
MQQDTDGPEDLEELEPVGAEFKHEGTVIIAIMAMLMLIFLFLIYRYAVPWLFNSHTDAGFIAGLLLLLTGWAMPYLLFFKVLRPLFKDIHG